MQPVSYVLEPNGRERVLADCLTRYKRIAICGAPETGKTTLTQHVVDRLVIRTDDFKGLPWGDQPRAVIEACSSFDSFVVEGIQVARALRKKLEVDVLIWLMRVYGQQTERQATMGRSLITILESCRDELSIPIFVVQ